MGRLETVLHEAANVLDGLGFSWAVVGGLAVSARTQPRFTRDVDLAVSVKGDADAERIVHGFQQHGYRVFAVVEQQATQRLSAIRLVPKGESAEGVVLDLMFASSGIEPDVVTTADKLELFPNLHVAVATVGYLIALKLLSADPHDRPQDVVDLAALRRRADHVQLAMAKTAVGLIESRGFNRHRDLKAALDNLAAQGR